MACQRLTLISAEDGLLGVIYWPCGQGQSMKGCCTLSTGPHIAVCRGSATVKLTAHQLKPLAWCDNSCCLLVVYKDEENLPGGTGSHSICTAVSSQRFGGIELF